MCPKSEVLVNGKGTPNWKSTPVWCSSVVIVLKRVALTRRLGSKGLQLLYSALRASSTLASAPITSTFFCKASFTASSTVNTWALAFVAHSRTSPHIQARRIIRSHPPRSAVSIPSPEDSLPSVIPLRASIRLGCGLSLPVRRAPRSRPAGSGVLGRAR
jgi:hypothetical protein